MTLRRVLLAAFALVAAADLVCLGLGFGPGHTVAKPLLMPLLAAYAASRGAPRLLLAALVFGWGGDVLLLSDAEPAFLAGMASFAAGHICYLALFKAYGRGHGRAYRFRTYGDARARDGLLVPACATALLATVASLWPDLPADLRVPVAGYSLLLTAMAYAAATRLGLLAGLGGALFLLSDTLIATGVADWPQPPRPDLWIMLTYLAAQLLLTAGTLDAHDRRPAPVTAYGEVRSTTP
ncbi:lysoplasmalogenase [Streptomyces sp. AC555_RSS877]|uniref:lysoplasmalogenase n=1 Tax=Streptomyces sp. AC555_RSS877 TaxID=2823688 RepID=UPI001C26A570|nr:lysoplasmalogenase [Streptomyces sp. AC555_RSS877]